MINDLLVRFIKISYFSSFDYVQVYRYTSDEAKRFIINLASISSKISNSIAVKKFHEI